ncbi:MAG: hypothetical protein K2H01_02320 [Ruminococcus sp.]|nr:hypothetical protein [Ruminococcus sp.]
METYKITGVAIANYEGERFPSRFTTYITAENLMAAKRKMFNEPITVLGWRSVGNIEDIIIIEAKEVDTEGRFYTIKDLCGYLAQEIANGKFGDIDIAYNTETDNINTAYENISFVMDKNGESEHDYAMSHFGNWWGIKVYDDFDSRSNDFITLIYDTYGGGRTQSLVIDMQWETVNDIAQKIYSIITNTNNFKTNYDDNTLVYICKPH